MRSRSFKATVGAAAATAFAVLLIFIAGVALTLATLDETERAALAALIESRVPLFALAAAAAVGAAALVGREVHRRWIAPPALLLEQGRVLLTTKAQRPLRIDGASGEVQALAQLLAELAGQRDQLRSDIATEVAQASRGIEQERSRLAALMNELTQSVVVCNLDGRVLLYNNRARMQFRTLSDTPALADGAELIGLGRSIYAVFDRRLIAHAMDSVRQRLQRGAASPSTQFVTATRAGQLLRAQLTPVRGVGEDSAPALSGFVLMLDNITRDYEQQSADERMLHGLTEGNRASLASLLAAAEMLDEPGLDPAMRERFLGVVRDEAQSMSRRINDIAARSAEGLATRWPLEEMLGADFVQAALRRIESTAALRTTSDEVDPGLWLKLDSFALLQALSHLAQRLHDEFSINLVTLRLAAAEGQRATLDLIWTGQAMSTETVMSWEMDPMASGSESSRLTVRDVVQRHGGEFWFERDRVRHRAFFRFLLPQAPSASSEQAELAPLGADSRPEYYDFDLFAASESHRALDERRLVDLAYTVFDTETTGLAPGGGDEIIQIGATRLVNGKVLRGESFDQLVNPRRLIPEAGVPIHGITQEMVVGKPTIEQVLPAFHRYAQDTVLVAHNAAFDMRFLQMKEGITGLKFDQPVLDTLLLSAVVHPNQASHQLEAIAERLGVSVMGRHTALGDAMVTAEVFIKLIALLAAQGIDTLGQARAAAQKTYFARIKY